MSPDSVNMYLSNSTSEDCLTVNVFASSHCLHNVTGLCPVIYYIHGGGWLYDSPMMFPSGKCLFSRLKRDEHIK